MTAHLGLPKKVFPWDSISILFSKYYVTEKRAHTRQLTLASAVPTLSAGPLLIFFP